MARTQLQVHEILEEAQALLSIFYAAYWKHNGQNSTHVTFTNRERARRLIAELISDPDWGALHTDSSMHGVDCQCEVSA